MAKLSHSRQISWNVFLLSIILRCTISDQFPFYLIEIICWYDQYDDDAVIVSSIKVVTWELQLSDGNIPSGENFMKKNSKICIIFEKIWIWKNHDIDTNVLQISPPNIRSFKRACHYSNRRLAGNELCALSRIFTSWWLLSYFQRKQLITIWIAYC